MEEITKATPDLMIQLAIDKGADLDKLEKLLILKERYEANEARKQYQENLVKAQKEMPDVQKKSKNSQTNSMYATLDEVIEKAKPVYTKYGFSVVFSEGETSKQECIRICADVIHSLGHKESYYYDVPLDGVGIKGNASMTKIHGKASSVSYGRRYLMCMIWNISTNDDVDGNKPSVFINEKQIEEINSLVEKSGADAGQFMLYMGISNYSEISLRDYKKAITALNAKMQKAGKK